MAVVCVEDLDAVTADELIESCSRRLGLLQEADPNRPDHRAAPQERRRQAAPQTAPRTTLGRPRPARLRRLTTELTSSRPRRSPDVRDRSGRVRRAGSPTPRRADRGAGDRPVAARRDRPFRSPPGATGEPVPYWTARVRARRSRGTWGCRSGSANHSCGAQEERGVVVGQLLTRTDVAESDLEAELAAATGRLAGVVHEAGQVPAEHVVAAAVVVSPAIDQRLVARGQASDVGRR